MAYLEVDNLTKTFQGNCVLDHIRFQIPQGAFVSLLGPSGCGKTTTLRLLAGLDRQDEGTISIDGQRIDGLPAHKRNMGMVFQSYALFPHMTVEENIAYGLEQRGYSKEDIKKEVHKALDMVQLVGMEKRKPKQLSGGQQQRVALARALIIKPSLLLLDESLSALDKKLRVDMQIELRQIQREVGITTVFVTHDQEEAMTLSDQIAIMNAGRIVQMDSPENVYQNPVSTFVAGFVGQSNFFIGNVIGRYADHCEFQLESGEVITFPVHPSNPQIQSGKRLVVSIRPEKIQVGNDGSSQHTLKGQVKFITYTGNLLTYLIQTAGQDVKVQQQNDSKQRRFAIGNEVYLNWEAENYTVIEE
jgi:spermidine/putrescine transport system ATP-binding protein